MAAKKNGVWIMRTLTKGTNYPAGTVYSYHYFEDDCGGFIYNITFHNGGYFAPIQIHTDERIHIKKAIKIAREKFESTKWCHQ